MSIDTLQKSQIDAAHILELPEPAIKEILHAQETRVVLLGTIAVRMDGGGTLHVPAARGISGPTGDYMDKGGARMTVDGMQSDVLALPQDMWAKLHMAGIRDEEDNFVNGGKLILGANPNTMNIDEKVRLFEGVADAMDEAGIAGPSRSVPAGDIGTNYSQLMDGYALRLMDRGYADSEALASITGKSPKNGGLEFRKDATGHGVYMAADYMRQMLNIEGPAQVTISGAGNVGSYTGFYMSQEGAENFSVRAVSDMGGTLTVMNKHESAGIVFDDEIVEMMNADFKSHQKYREYKNKIDALESLLAYKQPWLQLARSSDPNSIMDVPADVFIPASRSGLIDEVAARHLNVRGIVEAGNNTMTTAGAEILASRNMPIIQGELANVGGVRVSMLEQKANLEGIRIDFDEAREYATKAAANQFDSIDRAAGLFVVPPAQAAQVIGVAGMARQVGAEVPAEVLSIVAT